MPSFAVVSPLLLLPLSDRLRVGRDWSANKPTFAALARRASSFACPFVDAGSPGFETMVADVVERKFPWLFSGPSSYSCTTALRTGAPPSASLTQMGNRDPVPPVLA